MSVHCTGVVNDSGKKITINNTTENILKRYEPKPPQDLYWYLSNIFN